MGELLVGLGEYGSVWVGLGGLWVSLGEYRLIWVSLGRFR